MGQVSLLVWLLASVQRQLLSSAAQVSDGPINEPLHISDGRGRAVERQTVTVCLCLLYINQINECHMCAEDPSKVN